MSMLNTSMGFVGPELPPGFVRQPFDCPPESDFDASQRMGMCVDAASNPVYSQGSPGSMWTYYALDGSSWQVDPVTGAKAGGISTTYLYMGLGLLAVLILLGRRR